MNNHSNESSTSLTSGGRKSKLEGTKKVLEFKQKTNQIHRSFGTFKISQRHQSNGGEELKNKIRQLFKSRKTSVSRCYKNFNNILQLYDTDSSCPEAAILRQDAWNGRPKFKIRDSVCRTNNNININDGNTMLVELGTTKVEVGPFIECINSSTNLSLSSPLKVARNFTSYKQLQNSRAEPGLSALQYRTDESNADIELRNKANVQEEITKKEDCHSEEVDNVGVKSDTSQESKASRTFEGIVKKLGFFDGSDMFLSADESSKLVQENAVKNLPSEERSTKYPDQKQRTNLKIYNNAESDDKKSIPLPYDNGKEYDIDDNERVHDSNETSNVASSNCNFLSQRTALITDHTYNIRNLSSEQVHESNDCNNNDDDNNSNIDNENNQHDESDELLCVQIDQSKIKAVKNEILSNFRISNARVDDSSTKKSSTAKNKRKTDIDQYLEPRKKIRICDNDFSDLQNVCNIIQATLVRPKENETVGCDVEFSNFEKMDTDDVTDLVNKRNPKKPKLSTRDNDDNYSDKCVADKIENVQLTSEKNKENEMMEICEENVLRETEENEEMESDVNATKQTVFDLFNDLSEASDDQMGVSDVDMRKQGGTIYDDNENTKDMETDESGTNKLEDLMEEEEEIGKEDNLAKNSEDNQTRLRPRRFRTFLLTKERRSRAFLKQRSRILGRWFVRNFTHPYPTKLEKDQLARDSNMPRTQVSEWFGNMRRRIREATRGQHISWEEKVRRYNNLISDKSEPLPIMPGDLINQEPRVAEVPDDGKNNCDSVHHNLLSPKFKRNLLHRYMKDYSEIKPSSENKILISNPISQNPLFRPTGNAIVDSAGFKNFLLKNNSSKVANVQEAAKVIPFSNIYYMPIWREIRLNAENPVEPINKVVKVENLPVKNQTVFEQSTNLVYTDNLNNYYLKKKPENCGPGFPPPGDVNPRKKLISGNHRGRNGGLPRTSNTLRYFNSPLTKDLSFKGVPDWTGAGDEDSDERPSSIPKRIKSNGYLGCLNDIKIGKPEANRRSSDEIDAAYSLMELQKMF